MPRIIVASALASLIALPSAAKTRDEQMMQIDPLVRMEQRCGARAAGEVSRRYPGFQADRVVAYAFADPKIVGSSVTATGAAVRSKGHWCRLSFRCRTTPDGIGIESFEHTLRPEVPGWSEDQLAR
jgi:hypothetical protein